MQLILDSVSVVSNLRTSGFDTIAPACHNADLCRLLTRKIPFGLSLLLTSAYMPMLVIVASYASIHVVDPNGSPRIVGQKRPVDAVLNIFFFCQVLDRYKVPCEWNS